MDTKFSAAVHSLILISEAKEPLSSEEIAKSVGSNSSYIRKVLGYLKHHDLIESKQGVSGFKLKQAPQDISLLNVYQAINEKPFFDIHQNPSDQCIVGRHIKTTMNTLLEDLEGSISKALNEKTLQDCIDLMKTELTPEELKEYEDQ